MLNIGQADNRSTPNEHYSFPPIKVSAAVQEEMEETGHSILSFEYPELGSFQDVKKKV